MGISRRQSRQIVILAVLDYHNDRNNLCSEISAKERAAMLERVWIADLKKYQIVELKAHVADAAVRPSRRGALYLTMTLMDRTGTIRARLWDVSEADSDCLTGMRFVAVRGVVDQYHGALQLILWEPPVELEAPKDLT